MTENEKLKAAFFALLDDFQKYLDENEYPDAYCAVCPVRHLGEKTCLAVRDDAKDCRDIVLNFYLDDVAEA